MSSPDAFAPQQKYYDADEVEEYIARVTETIKFLEGELRDQIRRADQVERGWQGDLPEGPQATGLPSGPAVAAHASGAGAEARAAEVLRDAEQSARQLVDAAHAESRRLLETARQQIESAHRRSLEGVLDRHLSLLASVNTVAQRCQQLRDDLKLIEIEAAQWRLELAGSTTRVESWAPSEAPSPSPEHATQPPWAPSSSPEPAGRAPGPPVAPATPIRHWPAPPLP